MSFNQRQFIDWMNYNCGLVITPAVKADKTAAQCALGFVYPLAVQLAYTEPSGAHRNITMGRFTVLATLTETISNAGTNPKIKANKHLITFSGVVADTQTVTINGVIFEFDTGGAVTSGNVLVDVSGGVTAILATAALLTAIQANTSVGVTATSPTTTTILVVANTDREIMVSETCVNGAWQAYVEMFDGCALMNVNIPAGGTYVAAETVTVTIANITAPDGRTLTGGTSVFTIQ